jgi:hypothetical protein
MSVTKPVPPDYYRALIASILALRAQGKSDAAEMATDAAAQVLRLYSPFNEEEFLLDCRRFGNRDKPKK